MSESITSNTSDSSLRPGTPSRHSPKKDSDLQKIDTEIETLELRKQILKDILLKNVDLDDFDRHLVNVVDKNYDIMDDKKFITHLADDSRILTTLAALPEKVSEYFEEEKLEIRCRNTYSANTQGKRINIVIKTDKEVDDALDALDKLREEQWNDLKKGTNSTIYLNVEFI